VHRKTIRRFPGGRVGLAVLAALLVLGGLLHYMHWDDRGLFWLEEQHPSTAQRQQNIWLPDYRAVIQARELPGLASGETSGLTYRASSNTLFTVTGRHSQLVELSLDGEILRRIALVGFINPEAVEVLSDGKFAVSDERSGLLSIFALPDEALSVEASAAQQITLVAAGANTNKGFEGLGWDARHQRLILAHERGPVALSSLDYPITGAPQPAPLVGQHLFVRDLSSVAVDERTQHLLALSDESRLLLELDEQGKPVSFISLLGGLNGLTQSIKQAEGVAIDAEGNLYLVSEPNLFYRFEKIH
jgi:uncharacterized protein YjiK